MNQKTLFVLSASLLAQLTCAHSAVISYNWDYYGTIPTNSTSLAGVVSAANWNNSYDGTGASTTPPTVGSPELNLIDDSGNGTTMDIHFSGTGQWHLAPFWTGVPQDVDGTYNKSLLKGYVDMVGGNPVTISLAEICCGDHRSSKPASTSRRSRGQAASFAGFGRLARCNAAWSARHAT